MGTVPEAGLLPWRETIATPHKTASNSGSAWLAVAMRISSPGRTGIASGDNIAVMLTVERQSRAIEGLMFPANRHPML